MILYTLETEVGIIGLISCKCKPPHHFWGTWASEDDIPRDFECPFTTRNRAYPHGCQVRKYDSPRNSAVSYLGYVYLRKCVMDRDLAGLRGRRELFEVEVLGAIKEHFRRKETG